MAMLLSWILVGGILDRLVSAKCRQAEQGSQNNHDNREYCANPQNQDRHAATSTGTFASTLRPNLA